MLVGLSPRAAIMVGAILVVSGPTVVDPLMAFVLLAPVRGDDAVEDHEAEHGADGVDERALPREDALANLPGLEVATEDRFFDTVVQLVIGVLFVSISATISAGHVLDVLPGCLALVGVFVFVQRPLVAALATVRAGPTRRERAFVAWMDPRGIVAAATASVLAPQLVAARIPRG